MLKMSLIRIAIYVVLILLFERILKVPEVCSTLGETFCEHNFNSAAFALVLSLLVVAIVPPLRRLCFGGATGAAKRLSNKSEN